MLCDGFNVLLVFVEFLTKTEIDSYIFCDFK